MTIDHTSGSRHDDYSSCAVMLKKPDRGFTWGNGGLSGYPSENQASPSRLYDRIQRMEHIVDSPNKQQGGAILLIIEDLGVEKKKSKVNGENPPRTNYYDRVEQRRTPNVSRHVYRQYKRSGPDELIR